MSNLLITGKYGVLNAQSLLNTTSNNINNVSTEGYIRKQTLTYTSVVDWGVGDTYTRRIYDQYVQRQLFTDTASAKYYEAYGAALNTADKILSDSDMSIANSISDFFDSLSTATDSPTSTGSRETALAKLNDVVTRFNTSNNTLLESLKDANSKIYDSVDNVNSYAKSICDLNDEIRTLNISNNETNNEVYMQMLDERDRLVGKLAEEVSVNVQIQQDGTYDVYLDSGMLLCNGDTYAVLNAAQSQYDVTRLDTYIGYKSREESIVVDNTNAKLTINNIGGALGGYLNSTNEIRQAMSELGKMYVAFADALNEQNKAGFTLDDVAGSNLLSISDVWATSTNQNDSLLVTFNENDGENVQAVDIMANFLEGELHLYTVDAYGTKTEITDNYAIADTDTSIKLEDLGVTLKFNKSIADLKANKTIFYAQPTRMEASTASAIINKPEDFAFASAVRTRTTSNNYGNATISLARISNTGDGFGVKVNETTGKPEFTASAANMIKIGTDKNGQLCYDVYHVDNAGNATKIGHADGSCNGNNVLANAYKINADGSVSTTPLGDQGYDVNILGTIRENDSFTIELNEGGQADNSNGIALGKIRTESVVHTTNSTNTTTLTEGYANLLAQLGSKVSSAASNSAAAEAKLEQTKALYESDSGVNLDEEAVNLLQYQQTYQACAKIIDASQKIFDSLIAVM